MGFFTELCLHSLIKFCLKSPHFYDTRHFYNIFQRFVGLKEPVGKGTGKLKERVKFGPKGNVCMYVEIFFLCFHGLVEVFLWDNKHCGVCVGVTSVAIAGGDLGRGFSFFFFFWCKGEGVKIQGSKIQVARKEKPLK